MGNLELLRNFMILEKRLQQPARNSKEELSRLIADDFLEYGSSGRIYTKQQVIDELLASTQVPIRIDDFHARALAPNLVLTTYRSTKEYSDGRKPEHSLRSSIWVSKENEWRVLFHQGTPTAIF